VSWSLILVIVAPTAAMLAALALLRRARRDEFAEASRLAAARAVTNSTGGGPQTLGRFR
jgi:hypothetical protein